MECKITALMPSESKPTPEHGQSLQDPFLESLQRLRTPVSVYLLSGIRLQGRIQSFDQFVVSIAGTTVQVVYKRAISTIVPTAPAKMGLEAPVAESDNTPRTLTLTRRKTKTNT